MFGNPESLKTWEEILEIAVKGMRPESRARLEAVAQAFGCSVQEAAVATLHRFFDEGMELPDSEREWQR